MDSTCERCGDGSGELVQSSWHLGLIVYGRTTATEAVLCRPHARSLVLGDLGKTLVLGWWGILSFFTNVIVVVEQVYAWSRVRSMPDREAVQR